MTQARSLAAVVVNADHDLNIRDVMALPRDHLEQYILRLQYRERVHKNFATALRKTTKPADLHRILQDVVESCDVDLPAEFGFRIPKDNASEEAKAELDAAAGVFVAAQSLHMGRWTLCRGEVPAVLEEGRVLESRDLVITPGGVVREGKSTAKNRLICNQISSTLLWHRLSLIFDFGPSDPYVTGCNWDNTIAFVHSDGSQLIFSRAETDFSCRAQGTEKALRHARELLEFMIADFFYIEEVHPALIGG